MDQASRRQGHARRRVEVTRVLNAWDPIGVAGEVDDEYDCMVPALIRLLAAGADEATLRAHLSSELEDHFGLDFQHLDVGAVTRELVALGRRWRAGDTT